MDKDAKGRENIVVEYYSKQKWVNPIRTIVTDEFKYILYLDGDEELYDLGSDRFEVFNQASDSKYNDKKKELKNALLKWIITEDDPFFSYKCTSRYGQQIIKSDLHNRI